MRSRPERHPIFDTSLYIGNVTLRFSRPMNGSDRGLTGNPEILHMCARGVLLCVLTSPGATFILFRRTYYLHVLWDYAVHIGHLD